MTIDLLKHLIRKNFRTKFVYDVNMCDFYRELYGYLWVDGLCMYEKNTIVLNPYSLRGDAVVVHEISHFLDAKINGSYCDFLEGEILAETITKKYSNRFGYSIESRASVAEKHTYVPSRQLIYRIDKVDRTIEMLFKRGTP